MPEIKLVCKDAGVRLDVYVSEKISGYSRSFFKQLIDSGNVTVNGIVPIKSGIKIASGDVVVCSIPEPEVCDNKPQDIPLDIVYEDDDILVINKPQGMVVHPAAGHHDGTLVNALLAHCGDDLSDINGVIRPGIVHRIDKDTSGLMLACKNNETHLKLADMLSKHEIVRQYRAVVYGVVSPEKGTINAPIGRSDKDRKMMAVVRDGKPSVTHFEVIQRYCEATDLSLLLETGRTHQIRVHMSYIGHPVCGDPFYAGKRSKMGLSGQALHSSSITFTHPRTGEKMHFECDLPQYYIDLLASLTPITD